MLEQQENKWLCTDFLVQFPISTLKSTSRNMSKIVCKCKTQVPKSSVVSLRTAGYLLGTSSDSKKEICTTCALPTVQETFLNWMKLTEMYKVSVIMLYVTTPQPYWDKRQNFRTKDNTSVVTTVWNLSAKDFFILPRSRTALWRDACLKQS